MRTRIDGLFGGVGYGAFTPTDGVDGDRGNVRSAKRSYNLIDPTLFNFTGVAALPPPPPLPPPRSGGGGEEEGGEEKKRRERRGSWVDMLGGLSLGAWR